MKRFRYFALTCGYFHSSGYFKGQLIPSQQPKLFTGGIMRSYQIDGMEWIKVRRVIMGKGRQMPPSVMYHVFGVDIVKGCA